ncbi:acyl-CoA dehydrogenase family protein [Metabacillus fastidiosus]|uniref:acyl-CoA dehydrogenase family protein n=1 Tax=Metabacillus fastidiosus TaxID=1458 RepID=UPI003AEF1DB5
MNSMDLQFIKTNKQRELLEKTAQLAEEFSKRAALYDEKGLFPFENFERLKEEGYLKLTIPKKYGGDEISLYEFLLVQEKIAQGDGATALSLGWHLALMINLTVTEKWPDDIFTRICREIVTENKLLNTAASEPNSGSPARGGRPETTAVKKGDNWIINGKKIFTSLAPILDYFIIPASIEGKEDVAQFLISRDAKGLFIEETWNTLGMRATRSDDLILENVEVNEDALVEIKRNVKNSVSQGWLLHIPACYLGIAIAARNEAVRFAKTHQPSSLSHPIMDVPEVRRKVAEMDVKLLTARTFMYHTAEKWDENKKMSHTLAPELAAVKTVATNTAVEVVDLAMRIVGAQSIYKSNPLERYYRDVRAGLHNPPADDLTVKLLSDRAFME